MDDKRRMKFHPLLVGDGKRLCIGTICWVERLEGAKHAESISLVT